MGLNKLSVLIISAVILITGGALLSKTEVKPNKPESNNHVVELREDGFYPKEIVIGIGDKVTFKSSLGGNFWPASDPHPTHQFLDGFDPERPLQNGEEWAFVFVSEGTWRYHDHLGVSNRGTITVIGEGRAEEYGSLDNEKAFDEEVRRALKDEGVEAAFAVFTELFETNQAPASCHWTSHLIGEEVYKLFKAGEEFPVTNAVSYCGYGFFHGFMEKMLHENPDPAKGVEFCNQIGESAGFQARDNCIHGIGHGFTEEAPPPKEKWGNPEALLHPGLEVCEFLFGNTDKRWIICETGVYTVVAGWMAGNDYDLTLDTDDVFAFCRTQPGKYWTACYGEFAPLLDKITDWNPSKLKSHVEKIEDEKLQDYVVRIASGVMMQRDVAKDDWTDYIENCRKLPGNLPLTCIGGVAWGLVMHGPPGKEYEKSFRFCETEILTNNERDACYRESIAQLKRSYEARDKEKAEACRIINPSYKEELCYNY